MKTKFYLLLPLLLLFFVSSCNEDDVMSSSTDSFKRDNFNKPSDKTIFQLAVDNNLFQLYGAIQYVDAELGAGLEDAIKSNEVQITVFAPTDQAFVDLLAFLDSARPNETIDDITDVPAPIVLAVLQYHLTEGRRGSNSVVPKTNNNKTIETFLTDATFEVDRNKVIYAAGGNEANIIAANVSASNGMVHVIDAVILPLTPADVLALWDALDAQ